MSKTFEVQERCLDDKTPADAASDQSIFSATNAGTRILELQETGDDGRDVYRLIQIGVERGNDLEKILKTSKPEFVIELKRLIRAYRLVSNADNGCKHQTTLSRICDSFPTVTCSYIGRAVHTTVSVGKMQSLSKNYPTAMMTSAFAYLIPDRDETYCSLLKKAHMLHQYEFFATVNGHRMHTRSVRRTTDLINEVTARTDAAIRESRVDYQTQIDFLTKNRLIATDDGTITVTDDVLEAVNIWAKKIKGL